MLFRPAADKQELGLLLAGSLGEGPEMATHPSVCAFRDAYHGLMSRRSPLAAGGIVFKYRYGLRDFYNFGRYFARCCKVRCGVLAVFRVFVLLRVPTCVDVVFFILRITATRARRCSRPRTRRCCVPWSATSTA